LERGGHILFQYCNLFGKGAFLYTLPKPSRGWFGRLRPILRCAILFEEAAFEQEGDLFSLKYWNKAVVFPASIAYRP